MQFNYFFTAFFGILLFIIKLPAYYWLKYKQKTLQNNLEIQMESLLLMVPDLILRICIDNGALCIVTKCVHLVPY